MSRFLVLLLYLVPIGVESKKDSTEADFRKLPKLFHLDDYERCLERKDGIYCLGVFEIYSDVLTNPLFNLIQEKSQDSNQYNRSHLHRGYCLPTRCPSREANASARFERCADAWARGHSLRARLRTLHYCRAHGQPRPREPDTADLPHRLVLYFVCTMLVMAVVGTIYDYYFSKKETKNSILMSFSLRINWNHLTSKYQDIDPPEELAVINSLRFLLVIGMIVWHVFVLNIASYQQNPRFMEKLLLSPTGYLLQTSMVFTLTYILISNFLTSYYILLLSQKVDISLKHYPLFIVKRIIRVYPVYLLLHGFAATWWKSFGDGPLWPILLARESEVCRNKFWVATAFLQNIVNKYEVCLVQTWVIAVDMQLHLLTLFLTLLLVKRRQYAVRTLLVLFVVAMAFVAYKAFELELLPAYVYTAPETVRTFSVGADSFFNLYIQPITGIMIAIAGTILAFLHLDQQERGVKMSKSKILVFLHYISLPSALIWCCQGYIYFRHYERWQQHVMVVIERLVGALITGFIMYSGIHLKGLLYDVGRWSSMRTLSRLSFSVSMCHWCINVLLVIDKWTLNETSGLSIIRDSIAVYVSANIVAVLLTLLVDYPLRKFLDRLINQIGWFTPLKTKTQ